MLRKKIIWCLIYSMILCFMVVDASFAVWNNITPAVSTKTLKAIWGSSASDVYAVGIEGTIIHYNGTDWTAETSNTTAQLLSIWGSSSTNIYVVGKEHPVEGTATILRKTASGNTWGSEPLVDYQNPETSYDYDLITVWGYSSNNVYLGDQYGDIYIFNGTGWSPLESGPNLGAIEITGIWGVNSSNLFAISSGGSSVARYNGTDWENTDTGTTDSLNEIWGTSLSDIYVAGANGFISHYNGTSWLGLSSGTSNTLYSIYGSSATNVMAVGIQGTIVHNKGAGFVDESFSTVNDIFGVWVSADGQVAYAVGTDGIILRYEPDPGSSTTTTITSGTTTTTITGGGTTTTTITGGTTTTTVPDGSTTTTIPGNVTTTTVLPGEVGADFIASPLTGKAPLAVQFTNFSAGDITDYQWTFGDGGSSVERNPSHIYEDPGTYSVILTVIGGNGKTETKIRQDYITVKGKCPLKSSLKSNTQLEDLRTMRDSNLDDFSVMLMTQIYYNDAAEVNQILDEKPDLRTRLKELAENNIYTMEELAKGRPAMLSSEALSDIIDYLDEIKTSGSIKLQNDIDFIILSIRTGFLLKGLGLTIED